MSYARGDWLRVALRSKPRVQDSFGSRIVRTATELVLLVQER
jgi:hypothetical protein